MAANAQKFGDRDDGIHRALCVRHPDCKDLHFCNDCSLVFCAECRTIGIERVNHLQHSALPLPQVLNQRNERMKGIQKLVQEYNDFSQKHDIALDAIQKLKSERNAQLVDLNKAVDEFAAQLCREVEKMKADAKNILAKRAAAIWVENPEDSLQKEIDLELSRTRDVLALIDHEVRLCDRDELYLIEKNKELEKFASDLSELQQKTFHVPDKACDRLTALRQELFDQMTQLQGELNRSKSWFLKGLQQPPPFPRPDQLSLVLNAVVTFPSAKLVLPTDQDKSPVIRGVCLIDSKSDAIYLVDRNNSKIKELDLKTSQLTEVIGQPVYTRII